MPIICIDKEVIPKINSSSNGLNIWEDVLLANGLSRRQEKAGTHSNLIRSGKALST